MSDASSSSYFDVESATIGRAVLADLMRSTRAYDIVPDSNKVVVFDTEIPVRLAFYALLEHDTPCAPLWDSHKNAFIGLMTASDVADIMRVFYSTGSGSNAAATALSGLTIAGWRAFSSSREGLKHTLSSPDLLHYREQMKEQQQQHQQQKQQKLAWEQREELKSTDDSVDDSMIDEKAGLDLSTRVQGASFGGPLVATSTVSPGRQEFESHVKRKGSKRALSRLISIDPEENLLTLSQKLQKYRVHHIPVLDVEQNSVIAILSHRSLLLNVLKRFTDERALFNHSIFALGIGSFDDVVVVPATTSVVSVLKVLADHKISSVPIVNEAGQVVDIYSCADVAFLASDPTLQVLDAPVGEVRKAQAAMLGPPMPLVTCHRNESLYRCLELFAATGGRSQRLVCVDENRRCTGIVSLSDVFAHVIKEDPIVPRIDGLGRRGGGGGGGVSDVGGVSGGGTEETLGLDMYTC
jgi:CBS domain-containing protein